MKYLMILITFSLSALTWADSPTQQKLKAAVANDLRPKTDVKRDKNRLPVETMLFFGLKDDMKVMDLNPGSGYYVHLLAHTLKERGEFYVAINTDHTEKNVLKHKVYEHVHIRSKNTTAKRPEGSRYYQLKNIHLDETDLDMITNFRSYHNYSVEDRSALNDAVYAALKPGGVYAVIDHTRRHMEEETEENRRRIDPVRAIKEITDAGFEFVDYSTLHFRGQDGLSLEVGDKSVTGQTDRWTLKFKKPE